MSDMIETRISGGFVMLWWCCPNCSHEHCSIDREGLRELIASHKEFCLRKDNEEKT